MGEIGKGSGRIGAKRVAFHLWATARWPSIRERHHRRRGRKELREEEGKAALTGGSSCAARERTGGGSAMKAGRASVPGWATELMHVRAASWATRGAGQRAGAGQAAE